MPVPAVAEWIVLTSYIEKQLRLGSLAASHLHSPHTYSSTLSFHLSITWTCILLAPVGHTSWRGHRLHRRILSSCWLLLLNLPSVPQSGKRFPGWNIPLHPPLATSEFFLPQREPSSSPGPLSISITSLNSYWPPIVPVLPIPPTSLQCILPLMPGKLLSYKLYHITPLLKILLMTSYSNSLWFLRSCFGNQTMYLWSYQPLWNATYHADTLHLPCLYSLLMLAWYPFLICKCFAIILKS